MQDFRTPFLPPERSSLGSSSQGVCLLGSPGSAPLGKRRLCEPISLLRMITVRCPGVDLLKPMVSLPELLPYTLGRCTKRQEWTKTGPSHTPIDAQESRCSQESVPIFLGPSLKPSRREQHGCILRHLTQQRGGGGGGTYNYNSVNLYLTIMMPISTSAVERGSHTLPCVPGLQVGTSKTTTE